MVNAGSEASALVSLAGASMGTTWGVTFRDPGVPLRGLQANIQDVLDEVVAQMSTWDPDSAICRLNRAEPGWYQVAPAFFYVLQHSLQIARDFDGAFDPTMGGLVDLWGFGPAGPTSSPPAAEAIGAALMNSGWAKTELNAEHRGVWQPGGLQFDLSSIAKGFGVDEMGRVLSEHGVHHYLAELGGELKAAGQRAQGSPWRVDIESPTHEDRGLPLTLRDASIATSGHYRRNFLHDGRRYAHTIDPRTGRPLADDLVSVSVIHPQCLMADGLATALLVQGARRGPALARKHRIAALFITRHDDDHAVEWTDDFARLAGVTSLNHAS